MQITNDTGIKSSVFNFTFKCFLVTVFKSKSWTSVCVCVCAFKIKFCMYVYCPSRNKNGRIKSYLKYANNLKCLWNKHFMKWPQFSEISDLPHGTCSKMSCLWVGGWGFLIFKWRFYLFLALSWIPPSFRAWPGGFIVFASTFKSIMDASIYLIYLIYLSVFNTHKHSLRRLSHMTLDTRGMWGNNSLTWSGGKWEC